MKKSNRIILTAGLMLTGYLLFAEPAAVKAEEAAEPRIAEGVYIGGVDVGGMTEEEARDAMEEYLQELQDTVFTLKGADGSFDTTAEEMGVTLDAEEAAEEALAVAHSGSLINRYKASKDLENDTVVLDMKLEVDKQATARLLYDHRSTLNFEAVDNGLKRENGQFVFVPGATGTEVAIVDSVYRINDSLKDWDQGTAEIELVTQEVAPRGSREELEQITDVLGSFSTNFSTSGAGRSQNVKNGCAKINGSIVYPGEEFSVYTAVSPFTQENGYELAGSYLNGTTVESFGGGICQVSTTLYNAAIRAELEISMRFNHSMIVNYVNPSEDAAIAGTYKDFRFVNPYDVPIYIEGYCSGGVITFNIYGQETRPKNRKVSFESETISTTDPETEYRLSAEQPAGYYHVDQSAHQGIKARLWKVVSVDGKEQSRDEFNSSTYRASPKIVTIGTGGASEAQLAAIQEAVASKNEDAVKAAAEAAAQPQTPQTQTPTTPQTPATQNPQTPQTQTPTAPETPQTPSTQSPQTPETPSEPSEGSGSETSSGSEDSPAGE